MRAWLDADAAHDVNDVAAAADDPRVRGCGLLFSAVQYPFPGDEDNSEAMVSYLVARGADVRHRPLGTGPTPLHLACRRALAGAVRVLVRAGADVNAPFRLSPVSTPALNDFLAAPLSMLFNDFLLELARVDSDDRTTGEVQDDMYACMLDLLRAGAALGPLARGRLERVGSAAREAGQRAAERCPPSAATAKACAASGDVEEVPTFHEQDRR